MPDTLSGDPTPTTITQDTPPAPDPLTTLLSEIKDETGRQKYNDVSTALKALKASQEYIPTLKTELEALKERAELTKEVKTVEDLLNSVSSTSTPSTPAPEPAPVTTEPAAPAAEPSMEETLLEILAKKEARDTETSNLNKVKNTLLELYGEKATEMYEDKAKELAVNPAMLDAIACKSPEAVLTYFKQTKVPPRANLNSAVHASQLTPAKEPVKNVMLGATIQEVRDAWRACAPE